MQVQSESVYGHIPCNIATGPLPEVKLTIKYFVYPALIIMSQWQIQDFEKGGLVAIAGWRRRGIEVRSADPSARSMEKIFTFIFPLSGWALMHLHALHCKFQM